MRAERSPSVWSLLARRWHESRGRGRACAAASGILVDLWEFLRESTPERRRQRYGDVEYDWDHHVDTTSATVTHRTRLLAAISGAPYQPTEPLLFGKMMAALSADLRNFTFIDIGSGKGRTLLMASTFPFRRIIGVELLPELNQVALKNIADFSHPDQKCFHLESICLDARDYVFPLEPLVVYLFNPLPEAALRQVIGRLRDSLAAQPRPVRIIYHNPLSETVLTSSGYLVKTGGTHQFAIYSN
jgi:hypothetical protein